MLLAALVLAALFREATRQPWWMRLLSNGILSLGEREKISPARHFRELENDR